jgi:hypothetical protein
MRVFAATAAISGALLLVSSGVEERGAEFVSSPRGVPEVANGSGHAVALSGTDLADVVEEYCVRCHNTRRLTGNLSLEEFDLASAAEFAATSERMIVKLRAGMMPPAGARRPSSDTLQALAAALEETVARAAEHTLSPGRRVFPRLRLPLDTKSANFDNIADVQIPSAMLMDSYLSAAAEISRMAVGYPKVTETTTAYKVPRVGSQTERPEGAPRGTRGGMSVSHHFPADGEYVFAMEFHATPTGELYGRAAPFDEHIEVSIDGARVALLPIDRWSTDADPNGLIYETGPIPVTAGPHQVSTSFLRTFEGPVNDNLTPIRHSIADTQIGQEYGIANETHLRDLFITGPFNVTGVSETPSRRRVFTCRPLSAEEGRTCAETILARLGTQAYRRPLRDDDLADLMMFYELGDQDGGFETGVRMGLQAILTSPHFVFRMEEQPDGLAEGEVFPLSDADLATRLSFFLWGAPPDDELLRVVEQGRLQDDRVLEEQARRMLADPRSEGLATRFAAQWLRLPDLEKLHPDALEYPHYDLELAEMMRRETELFFHSLVTEDRSLFELFNADYTFVNERLARHYEIPGIGGDEFRRVQYPDENRRGIFGHGSVLTLTSHANRTSPVLRGKWIMEVLMGTPPPPPPPNVPPLEESTEGANDEGRAFTTAERMAMHRSNPTCASCHSLIDPIGLALENFDVTGTWRIREGGTFVDASGELYDGTPLDGPGSLREALMRRPIPLVRNFTQNLFAYGLGRRIGPSDMPTVRKIAREAEAQDYNMSAFIFGVVKSDAFRMQTASTAATDVDAGGAWH